MTAEPSMRTSGRQTGAARPHHQDVALDQPARSVADSLEFGPFHVSPTERLLTRNGSPVPIGGRAFDLLLSLLDRAGQIVGARQLHNLVWPDVVVEEANLRVCVATLRKALGEHTGEARYVVNVTGRGYAFVAPVRRASPEVQLPHPNGGGFRAVPDLRQPPQLIISRNETIDVLSRLLASGRFARVTDPGDVAPPEVARALLALLHDAGSLDAACFALRAQESLSRANGQAAPASADSVPQAASSDGALGAYLAENRLLIVLGRCQHLAATVTSLFDTLSRLPSVYFLATGREASRGFANTPWFAHARDDPSDATAMTEALDEIGIAALPYLEWRAEFSRQRGDGYRCLEDLQQENERLRQAISDLTLEKLILKEASFGNL